MLEFRNGKIELLIEWHDGFVATDDFDKHRETCDRAASMIDDVVTFAIHPNI